MALKTPNLDDRTFQSLVDEAKKKIPLYCPEWTDHNVSDPGITLIELFAWLTETLLYRLNQVPDKHYVKLMELLGIRLQEPRASHTAITFWLSAPQPDAVHIPAGVEASTARVEGSEPVVFTTDAPLIVQTPNLTHIMARRGSQYVAIGLRRLSKEFRPFSDVPQVGDALYLGFEQPLDHHILGLELDCVRAKGKGIIPEYPPLRFQVWCSSPAEVGGPRSAGDWQEAELEEDGTGGLNWSGQIKLHLPGGMTTRTIGEATAHWVRIQVVETAPDQPSYEAAPELRGVTAVSWGGTVAATHAAAIRDEILGRSDGSPGQVFHLERSPILARGPDERVQVWRADLGAWEDWQEVEDFGGSNADDRHVTCDGVSGEVCFGPALRQPDGTIHRYGAIPPRGAEIRILAYRYGGGAVGNVRAGAVTELKAAIPYVDRVVNRRPASGGLDAENLEDAKLRAPHALRTRRRAVTAADFEHLTYQEFAAEVSRVRCLQAGLPGADGRPGPGQIYILVIPRLPEHLTAGYVPVGQLVLSEDLRGRIADYLDDHRLLTTQLTVRAPDYRRVAITAEVKARAEADLRRIEQAIAARLEALLNPFIGGTEGSGWPFGRALYLSDLYACIQAVAGVEYIKEIKMAWLDNQNVPHSEDKKIELLDHEVIVSDKHTIKAESQ
ncbi:MAG: putative baseplate assembly protein [Anaerolineae bacterium]|nr:putative baseplate assembly protein [Anaerolineae bacterium]